MSKILLAGDSWACGEWGSHGGPVTLWTSDGIRYLSNNSYGVTHLGLEEYFSEHNVVLNTAVPGSNNSNSIKRLSDSITLFNPDLIIWVQTDPIRDLRIKNYDALKFPRPISLRQFFDLQHNLIEDSYIKLDAIGVPIICMGGTFKINISQMEKYTNLNPLIPSMIEFINPDLTAPDIWISEWIQEELLFNDECMCQLETNKKLMSMICDNLHFSQCGHPKRPGLKKIYAYINDTQF